MRRRDLLALLGGAALSKPMMARAERTSVPVIGFLSPSSWAKRAGE